MEYNYELLAKTDSDITESHYIYRIGKLIDEGKLPHWKDIYIELNKQLGRDEDEYLSESAFRKPYQYCKKFVDNGVFDNNKSQSYEIIEEQIRELEKAKVKFRDQKNAWQKQNRETARVEELINGFTQSIIDIGKSKFTFDKRENIYGYATDRDLIVCLSDLHIGQTFESKFGKYNTDIAKDRLKKYLNHIKDIYDRHDIERIYVCGLGDQISNSIHKSLQVTNRENVIEQVKIAIELISNFIYELTRFSSHVYFLSVDGNHTRIDKKDDAIHDERLDNLISWTVSKMLGHIENFDYLEESMIDSGISCFDVRGNSYFMVHGDYDKVNNASVGNLCAMLRKYPIAILRGHNHTPALNEINGVKVVQSGSLAGSGDNYTIELRATSNPSQTCLVVNQEGIECIYNVDLK